MVLASILGFLGSIVTGIFGLKKAQGQAISESLDLVGKIDSSEAQREHAIATIIAAENSNGSGLSSIWRPLTMLIFLGMIVSYWFGYIPKGLLEPVMPPMIAELFSIVKLGLGGYIGGRTLEKVVSSINLGVILKKYIEKKLV